MPDVAQKCPGGGRGGGSPAVAAGDRPPPVAVAVGDRPVAAVVERAGAGRRGRKCGGRRGGASAGDSGGAAGMRGRVRCVCVCVCARFEGETAKC